MTVQEKTKLKVATMNAVHDLPVLVARDRGFFRDEGLDLEFVTTPGMAQVTTSHSVKFDSAFERPLDSVYNDGGIDQYRMCEWGIMKRAVKEIEKDPTPYLHYLVRETGGLLEPAELQAWRLLHAAPQPYTRERFDDTCSWTVKWSLTVPGATYENIIDNRAWQ